MVCFLPIFSYIKAESWILSLDGKIRVRQNPYSRIFYVVEYTHNPKIRKRIRIRKIYFVKITDTEFEIILVAFQKIQFRISSYKLLPIQKKPF